MTRTVTPLCIAPDEDNESAISGMGDAIKDDLSACVRNLSNIVKAMIMPCTQRISQARALGWHEFSFVSDSEVYSSEMAICPSERTPSFVRI